MVDGPRPENDALKRAIEVFVRGFAITRSGTHPASAERIGPAWAVRDAPRRRGTYRVEEWTAHGVAPATLDALARTHARDRFSICAITATDEPDAPLRAAYRALGHRLVRTEALMVHDLRAIPSATSPVAIERVQTPAAAEALARASRSRPLPAEDLTTAAPRRAYVACADEQVVGWVRSIVVGDATWCASMFVSPDWRRRGIATALLCSMLADDRAGGAHRAVLLATHTGAKLYPTVGYRQIGTLWLFLPPRA